MDENRKEVECPFRHSKIDHLINVQDAMIEWKFYANGDYSSKPEITSDDAGENVNEWICPECWEIISNNEKDAREFLNGKKIIKVK